MDLYSGSLLRGKTLSAINIVPYVDVMLVLLVIFMGAIPMLITGVDVDLPNAELQPLSSADDHVVISVTATKELSVNFGQDDITVDLEGLLGRMTVFIAKNPEALVVIWADQSIDYGYIIGLMGQLNRVGITNVTLAASEQDSEEK